MISAPPPAAPPPPPALDKRILHIVVAGMLVGVAMAVPPGVCSMPQWWSRITAAMPGGRAADDAAVPDMPALPDPIVPGPLPQGDAGLPAAGVTEVFRFDITPGWIVARWPRVSTGLGQLDLQGYRVPLLTGVAEDDLAGALTYYFNVRQELQRITFFGTTGDPRKLTYHLVTHYNFVRRLTNDPGVILFETRSRYGEPKSALWVRPVRVVRSTEPHAKFEVALSFERP